MLKISDVSKVTGLPVKTIRYWEEMHLIVPAMVDAYTGYRRFDEKNVERLSQISYLKELGFSLKEIASLNDDVIQEKSKQLQEQLIKLRKSIREISSFGKNKKGEYMMNHFINDEKAIGHWKLLGIAETKEKAALDDLSQCADFKIKDLYLMEGGKSYWVIAWTKGYLKIKNNKHPYEIDGNKMTVALTYDGEVEGYAVYEKIDSINHQESDFIHEDNIDLPFVNDPALIGFWKTVDLIRDKNNFTVGKREWKGDLWLQQIAIAPNGDATFTVARDDEKLLRQRWTKGLILNPYQKQAMHYDIVEREGETYLIMEWKSGDYMYAGDINCYYVLQKMN